MIKHSFERPSKLCHDREIGATCSGRMQRQALRLQSFAEDTHHVEASRVTAALLCGSTPKCDTWTPLDWLLCPSCPAICQKRIRSSFSLRPEKPFGKRSRLHIYARR